MRPSSFFAAALLAIVHPTYADTIYVPPGENLQAAIDLASDGDVIQLGAGDYYRYNGHELANKTLTIRGELDASGVPVSRFPNPSRAAFVVPAGIDKGVVLRLENLMFDGGVGQGVGWMLTIESDVTVVRCHFRDWSGFAGSPVFVKQLPGSSRAVFLNCIIGEDRDTSSQYATKGFILNWPGNELRLVDCQIERGSYPGVDGGFRTDPVERGDVNGDGNVDESDLGSLQDILGTCSGDLNGDGEFSGADIGLLLILYGTSCP